MSHANAASLFPSPRRRSRGASSSMALDTRYSKSASRRQRHTRPAPVAEELVWPDWLIPGALITVMAAISAYHYDALLAALRSVV